MIIVKGDNNSEAGVMPDAKMLAEMGNYNEQLVKAGVMLAGEGLHPTVKGRRVQFTDSEPMVIPGPFAGADKPVAGFWLWRLNSMDEAVDWVKKAPFGPGAEIEIRPVFEDEEFAEADPSGKLIAKEKALRKKLEAQLKPKATKKKKAPRRKVHKAR